MRRPRLSRLRPNAETRGATLIGAVVAVVVLSLLGALAAAMTVQLAKADTENRSGVQLELIADAVISQYIHERRTDVLTRCYDVSTAGLTPHDEPCGPPPVKPPRNPPDDPPIIRFTETAPAPQAVKPGEPPPTTPNNPNFIDQVSVTVWTETAPFGRRVWGGVVSQRSKRSAVILRFLPN